MIDEVIRSETTEPSIPAVVLDTINDVINEGDVKSEILTPAPDYENETEVNVKKRTTGKIVSETQEIKMELGDDSDHDSHKTRKETTPNGKTVTDKKSKELSNSVTKKTDAGTELNGHVLNKDGDYRTKYEKKDGKRLSGEETKDGKTEGEVKMRNKEGDDNRKASTFSRQVS
jgi:hypothetical protein